MMAGGMYQVVHRFETISTTTAVVPNSEESPVGPTTNTTRNIAEKYTPLSALASLQPTGSIPPPPTRFPSKFQNSYSQTGFFQPAGPLIRPASPTTITTTAAASSQPPPQVPPTATVPPTVVSSSSQTGSSTKRPKESSSSPVKPSPQPLNQTFGTYPGYPYPTNAFTTSYPPPPPAHVQYPAGHPVPHGYPYTPVTYGHTEFRPHYPVYPSAPLYQPSQGSYYLAPAIPFQPSVSAGAVSAPPSVAVTTSNQIALPGTPGSYFYGGYAPHVPYTPAPPPAHPSVPQSGFPPQEASVYSAYSVHQDMMAAVAAHQQPKNVQAGSQVVGKGPNSIASSSQSTRPTNAIPPTPTVSHQQASSVKDKESLRPILPKQQRSEQNASSTPSDAFSKPLQSQPPASVSQQRPVTVGQTTIIPVTSKQQQDALKRQSSAPPVSNMTTITPVTTTKSSLRDYRKPKSQRAVSSMSNSTSLSSSSINSVSMSPVVSSVVSKNVNMLPVQRPVEGRKHPIVHPLEDLIPSKRHKQQKQQQSLHLPEGTTINPIDIVTHVKKPFPAPMVKPQVQMLPVQGNTQSKNYLKTLTPTMPNSTGHPGLPNGLLRVATASMQQPGSVLPQVATKVIPKDSKSQLALSKIGIPGSNQSEVPKRGQPMYLKPQTMKKPMSITMSMAKNAVSAVPIMHSKSGGMKSSNKPKLSPPIVKQSKNNNTSKKVNQLNNGQLKSKQGSSAGKSLTGSPNSSRSSSRNSSLSPRERSGSASKGCSSSNKNGKPTSPTSKPTVRKKIQPNVPLVPWSKRNNGNLKVCNGWSWVGEGIEEKVFLNNEDAPVYRICYDSMKHVEGDEVKIRDCIVLASGHRKKDLPFIAKVTHLWENPNDGEMMMSLLWYYRPEHLENGRKSDDLPDEIYASRHRDITSVACIEDKCYVMTFNEYCRYKKFLRMVEEGVTPTPSIVPDPPNGYDRIDFLPTCRVAHDRVFLCRKVYESRQRRILKNPYTR